MTYIIKNEKHKIPADSLFKQLEERRIQKGISKEDMANGLGVSSRTYYNWIHNGTTQANVKKIENVLDNWRN